jgi:hypothetical protein
MSVRWSRGLWAAIMVAASSSPDVARADEADGGARSHVTFVRPEGFEDLDVRFDDRPVPSDGMTRSYTVDPGDHRVTAQGIRDGKVFRYEGSVHLDPGQTSTVTLPMTLAPDVFQGGYLPCMLGAKTQEEANACMPQSAAPPPPEHAKGGCGSCRVSTSEKPAPALIVVLGWLAARSARARVRRRRETP